MSLPAAAVPVAVLVLAWDEATPAVRALVEATEIATPLFDSVVVLVPAGPAGAEKLSQEEFLPLDAPPLLPSADHLPHPTAAAVISVEAATLPNPTTVLSAAILAPGDAPAPASLLPVATEAPAETPLPPAGPEAGAVPPLSWSVVRVLRLSSFSLPELAQLTSQALPQPIWQGILASPAAPYLGQSAAATAGVDFELQHNTLRQSNDYQGLTSNLELSVPALGSVATPTPLPAPEPATAAAPPDYFAGELPAPAIDAESDLAPVLLASDDAAPEAAVAEAPLATEFAPARTDWPAALASLREPAPPEAAAPLSSPTAAAHSHPGATLTAVIDEPAAPAGPPALRPVQHQFDAPNLNFQVIQYARFAVPVALAEAPFEAIYAPAWPTWLAAQELRQRTGRPLVLHVANLAAAADESVETATGWQAELQRQALHRADLILTETPTLAYRLRQELSLPAHLVRPVPAADAAAIAQALRTARPRPLAGLS